MRFSISIFFTSLIPPLTHAMPTCQNDTFTPPLPSWTVNAFQAYTSPNLSYASFVINSTPTFPESNNRLCGISSNSSIYESIYQSKMILCEGRPQMWFQIQETEVVLRSTWKTESGDWVTGIAPQGTYWMHGEGGNVTEVDGGKLWSRSKPWNFPIETLIA